MTNGLVFDVESAPITNAADYLESISAPSNYVKQDAIAAYIEKANAEQLAKAALDIDLARIVAIGWSTPEIPSMVFRAKVFTANDEATERIALESFWRFATSPTRPRLIGFNCIAFDLPLLLRRSLYLGIETPRLPINKYRHDGIEDLMLRLSFDGATRMRGLRFYAKRFGLNIPADKYTGADMPALVAAGDYDAIAAHCRADVETTVALARRIGVL